MRRLLPAVVAVISTLLAGCSGDGGPEPKIAPTDSSSVASTPITSPSPTGPVEPTLPPEAEGDDAAAAEAFVEHFWAMVNFAQATGEVDSLRMLGTPTCAACGGGIDQIVQTYAAGGAIEGGDVSPRTIQSEPYQAGSASGFLVTVKSEVDPQTVSVPGEDESSFPGGSTRVRMIVERSQGQWLIARMDPA